ncbi:MAG: restriction endonuclease [Candidatus Hodarchaeales archaeon]
MATNLVYRDRFTDMELRELAIEFLNLHDFDYHENLKTSGISGQDHKIDIMITGQKNQIEEQHISTGIILRDYRKSVGADGICQAERLLKDCSEIKKIVIMANEFSVPARNLAERCGLPVISRGELVSMLLKPKGIS